MIRLWTKKKKCNPIENSARRQTRKRSRRKVAREEGKEEEGIIALENKIRKDINDTENTNDTHNCNLINDQITSKKQNQNSASQNSKRDLLRNIATNPLRTIAPSTAAITNATIPNKSNQATIKLFTQLPFIQDAAFAIDSANNASAVDVVSNSDIPMNTEKPVDRLLFPNHSDDNKGHSIVAVEDEKGWEWSRIVPPMKKRRLNTDLNIGPSASFRVSMEKRDVISKAFHGQTKLVENTPKKGNGSELPHDVYKRYDIVMHEGCCKKAESKERKKPEETEIIYPWSMSILDECNVQWDVRQLLKRSMKMSRSNYPWNLMEASSTITSIPHKKIKICSTTTKKNILRILNDYQMQMQQDWINLVKAHQNPYNSYWRRQSKKKRLAIEAQILSKEKEETERAKLFFGEEYVKKYRNKHVSDIIAKHQQIIISRNLQSKKHIHMALQLKIDAMRQRYQETIHECLKKLEVLFQNQNQDPAHPIFATAHPNCNLCDNHPNFLDDLMAMQFKLMHKELKLINKRWKAVKIMSHDLHVLSPSDTLPVNSVSFHLRAITTAGRFLRLPSSDHIRL